ncbi:dihydroneopterin aldolase [Candidatus Scalindua japonica]|uniref:7,8-dihydroneopterin aldolase n=1 Tax=Candidatus Scalindua japonica TaxID=1284222 RepID=A0A286TWD0_9BACT|nr:dihydroneopterin aldolase [Candidatus Scalindua japonica]GAX60197.1 dihydroneopterin aldolase [Candidatus Scalindua japonica]
MNEVSEYNDKIHIRDLALRCIIGINPEERTEKQDVIINVVLFTDTRIAGQTDSLGDSVDYKTVKKTILALVECSEFLLIERLAEEIAKVCLDNLRVQKVNVTVDKPGALRYTRSVAVEIMRTRKCYGQ